jgi:hypothetical protein
MVDEDSDSGMMMMQAVEALLIPANGEVTLEPGGRHVMLMQLTEPFAVGAELSLTLQFEQAGEIVVPGRRPRSLRGGSLPSGSDWIRRSWLPLPTVFPRTVEGSVRLRRVGRLAFPIEELVGPDGPVAHLGRNSSLKIFFGPGRRVRFADGTEWRIKAVASGRHIVPIVTSPAGTVAVSGPLFAKRSYGINTKDKGFTLIPVGNVGRGIWVLRRHEFEAASIDEHARVLTAAEPIPVGAILMAFTLMSHGIPGEAELMPKRD